MKFDVHHAGAIGGTPIGAFIQTIDEPTHGAAKTRGEELHPGVRIVILPHRPVTEKLAGAIRRLERRPPRDRQRWRGKR